MDQEPANQRHNVVRVALYTGMALLFLVILYVADRATGGDVVGRVLGHKQQDSYDEYYEGGFSIGKWRVVDPQPKKQTLGAAWEYLGNSLVPTLYVRTWYEDGALESEATAYDARGSEVPFIDPTNIDPTAPPATPTFPKVVMKKWYPSGNIQRQTEILNGVPRTIREWHESGEVMLEGQYDAQGKRHGSWKSYASPGAAPSIEEYTHGEYVSEHD